MSTEAVDRAAARMAEGWCPHPDHGQLGRIQNSPWGRCDACNGQWMRGTDAFAPRLEFRVRLVDDLGLVREVVQYLPLSVVAASRREAAAVERLTAEAHRLFTAGLAEA